MEGNGSTRKGTVALTTSNILEALKACNFNRALTARVMNVDPKTIYSWVANNRDIVNAAAADYRKNVSAAAEMNIADSILMPGESEKELERSDRNSKWWLEHMEPDFMPKSEVRGKQEVEVTITLDPILEEAKERAKADLLAIGRGELPDSEDADFDID